jgi:hypothetical protein
MSFSSLKQNKGNIFSKLQKQLEQTTKVGTTDERIWKPTQDKAGNAFAVIRFLPASDGEDMPFVKMYSHAFQGVGGWYIENSLTTLGQNDPLGEYNRELWNSGDESLKDQVRKQKRKLQYYANIYVVKDPSNPENEGQVKLFRFGKKIYDKIMDSVNGDELEGREGFNPFDFWTGADFKLRMKKVAGYPNYDSSEFQPPSTLDELDDAQLESIWKRQYELQPLIAPDQFKSYEDLKKRLDAVLNLKSSGSVAESTPRTAEAVVSTKPSFSASSVSEDTVAATKEANVVPQPEASSSNEEGEEDVLDYFRKLAEE